MAVGVGDRRSSAVAHPAGFAILGPAGSRGLLPAPLSVFDLGSFMAGAVLQTRVGDLPVRRGKVRDIYDLGSQLLMVSTDRISAFDWILPTGIPDKGRVLTQTSAFWFDLLDTPNHLLSLDLSSVDLPAETDREQLDGRSMLVRKAQVVPI